MSLYVGYQSEWDHPPYNIGEGKPEHRYLAERSNISAYMNLVAEQVATNVKNSSSTDDEDLDYIDPRESTDYENL